MRGARELLIERRRDDDVSEYRLHHDSIRGQISRAIGAAALRGHHRALAQKLAVWPPVEPDGGLARNSVIGHIAS